MPLPPALLERLKRRKIIQEVKSDEPPPPPSEPKRPAHKEIDHLQARYGHGETSSVVQSEQDGQEEIIAADYSDEAEQDSDEDEQEDQTEASSNHVREFVTNRLSPEEQDVDYDQDRRERDNDLNSNEEFHHHCDITETVIGCPNKYNIHHFCSAYCAEKYSQPDSMEPTIDQRRMLARLLKAFPITNEWSIVYDPGVKTFYFWNIINHKVSWYPPGMGTMPVDSAESWRKLSRAQAEFGGFYGV